jgi:23S rRNA (adenine2503-C2)-methyltransferase
MSSPSSTEVDAAPNLYGRDLPALTDLVRQYGVPDFHASHIYRWMYGRRNFDPGSWTDLSKRLRERIRAEFRVSPGTLGDRASAADGTVKFRVRLHGGGSVEAVYMEHDDRVTLCISSQVGCALACDFCLTGRMGLLRQLDPGEIVGQVALIQKDRGLGERPVNVVFMGMGEPLHNYDGVVGALRLLTSEDGFGLSRKRITVSTAGMAEAIERLATEGLRTRLAVSLNATTDTLRSQLMPINRKYPIERLVQACRRYAEASGERFTFEYVLLAGVNDRDEDVRRLAKLARTLPVKVNLIPFNSVPGWLDFRPPAIARVETIRDGLLAAGVPARVRWSRGAEARAACGQLALLPGRPPASRRDRPRDGEKQ